MKNKILPLIIGILIGAIITSIGFIIYIKTNNINKRHDFGGRPQMNQTQNSNQNSETPPEIPNGEAPNNMNENLTSSQDNEQTETN